MAMNRRTWIGIAVAAAAVLPAAAQTQPVIPKTAVVPDKELKSSLNKV